MPKSEKRSEGASSKPGTVRRAKGPRAAQARRRLLAEMPVAWGEAWATAYRAEIHAEGRRAGGGFPGTMTEARARFGSQIDPKLVALGMQEASFAERALGAQLLYRTARSTWLAFRES